MEKIIYFKIIYFLLLYHCYIFVVSSYFSPFFNIVIIIYIYKEKKKYNLCTNNNICFWNKNKEEKNNILQNWM